MRRPSCFRCLHSVWLPLLVLAGTLANSHAQTPVIGWWRFEESAAKEGTPVGKAENTAGPATAAAVKYNAPLYTKDVPASQIFDPTQKQFVANQFAITATRPEPQALEVPCESNAALNSNSFTLEFFVRQNGAGPQFTALAGRMDGSSGWALQHGNDQQQNKLRVRFQTDAGRNQFIFGDLFLGDNEWHHVALQFQHMSDDEGDATLYVDYSVCGNSITVHGPLANNLPLIFLKPAPTSATASFSITMDEVRLTSGVLPPEMFLRTSETFPK